MCEETDHDHVIDTGKGTILLQQLGSLLPGMAELMPLIGDRVWRVYYAGLAKNRPLAMFQLKEAVNLMHKAVVLRPKYCHHMQNFLERKLLPLQTVIESEEWEKFDSAFSAMVDAANAYHRMYEKPFLRWKVPDVSPPDLDMTESA